jgi:predicted hydrocarbon binding protein
LQDYAANIGAGGQLDKTLTQAGKVDLKEVLEENAGFFLDFEMFAEMKKALEETFSSGAMVIIAIMAKPCGQRICRQIMGKVKTKEEALSKFSRLVNEQNWGELSFHNFDFPRGSSKAVVKSSFEARQHQSKTPCCHFLANFIAGFMSEMFAKNVMVKEEKCAASGDPYCEFKF